MSSFSGDRESIRNVSLPHLAVMNLFGGSRLENGTHGKTTPLQLQPIAARKRQGSHKLIVAATTIMSKTKDASKKTEVRSEGQRPGAGIEQPRENDCLQGRGGLANNWIG